jgi:drug/metabolite transporter (DMT)-like permease
MYYLALFGSIVLNAASLILLKFYALRRVDEEKKAVPKESGICAVIKPFLDPFMILCILLYGFAALLWLIALLRVDLMVAYPSLSCTYVIIAIFSKNLFNEKIVISRWFGMFLIVSGVVVMNV